MPASVNVQHLRRHDDFKPIATRLRRDDSLAPTPRFSTSRARWQLSVCQTIDLTRSNQPWFVHCVSEIHTLKTLIGLVSLVDFHFARAQADSKRVEEIRAIAREASNRYCFDCNKQGPQFNVVVDLSVFVCTDCAGLQYVLLCFRETICQTVP